VWYFPTSHGRRLYRSPTMGAALKSTVSGFSALHLHSVFLWPTLAGARAARRARIPYVLAPRGMLVPDLIHNKSRMLKLLWIAAFERRNLERAAAVHVTSTVEAEDFTALGLKTNRIVVIPNGIDIPSSLDLADDRNGSLLTDTNATTVLSLGRLNWKKRLDLLIAAMPYVPSVHLVIAGNDEEGHRPELEAMAADLGLSHRISFLGPVHGEAKWRLLASADVFAMPSHSENFGISALEAMACGVPVIVTKRVGLADSVADMRAGLVVDSEPRSIANAIETLARDPEGRRRLGAAGRLVAKSFSWAAIALSAERLYLEIGARDMRSRA